MPTLCSHGSSTNGRTSTRAWIAELPPMDLYGALLFQVTGQQLSVAATRRTLARVEALFDGRLPSPTELLAADPTELRARGLSWRKVATLRDLAERLTDGRLDTDVLSVLPDDQFIAALTAVPGIGPWTAEGALILALEREDVVLPGDLAFARRSAPSTSSIASRVRTKSSPSPRSGGPTAASRPATCSRPCSTAPTRPRPRSCHQAVPPELRPRLVAAWMPNHVFA